MTIAGRSMIQQSLFDPDLGPALRWVDPLLMPLWLWGPALAVATLAYWSTTNPKVGHARRPPYGAGPRLMSDTEGRLR